MMETMAVAGARTRTQPPRDAQGRFVARPGAAAKPGSTHALLCRDQRGRVRVVPSRDARGRFVAFPTTNAPGWYVLCADSYRIPGEADVMPYRTDVQPAPQPQPLPIAKVIPRRRRPVDWAELATWILMALF